MLELYVDPFVLACPGGGATAEDIEGFVERLLRLRDLQNEGVVNLFVSDQAFDVLESTGSYPVGDRTQRFAFQQRRDVLQVVQKLLLGRSVEQVSAVEDIVVERYHCSPNDHLAGRQPAFAYQYHRLHALIDHSIAHCGMIVKCPSVFTSGLANGEAVVHASGTVPVCVHSTECDLPREYSVKVQNVSDTDAAITVVDPIKEWQEGRVATAIAVALVARGHRFQAKAERTWSLGGQFTQTARDYGFMHEEGKIRRLLNASVDSILSEQLRAVHELRTGHGANDPQRTRTKDRARAWRRDIDDEFHLHYWQSERGVELASVVVHNVFTIPN